jgi:hypothetical protein
LNLDKTSILVHRSGACWQKRRKEPNVTQNILQKGLYILLQCNTLGPFLFPGK